MLCKKIKRLLSKFMNLMKMSTSVSGHDITYTASTTHGEHYHGEGIPGKNGTAVAVGKVDHQAPSRVGGGYRCGVPATVLPARHDLRTLASTIAGTCTGVHAGMRKRV